MCVQEHASCARLNRSIVQSKITQQFKLSDMVMHNDDSWRRNMKPTKKINTNWQPNLNLQENPEWGQSNEIFSLLTSCGSGMRRWRVSASELLLISWPKGVTAPCGLGFNPWTEKHRVYNIDIFECSVSYLLLSLIVVETHPKIHKQINFLLQLVSSVVSLDKPQGQNTQNT